MKRIILHSLSRLRGDEILIENNLGIQRQTAIVDGFVGINLDKFGIIVHICALMILLWICAAVCRSLSMKERQLFTSSLSLIVLHAMINTEKTRR